MTSYPPNQTILPPDLPPYLKSVHKLEPIVGAPNDDQLIGILSVIRVAQKAIEIPGMGDHILICRLSEYLFDAQMARYRSNHYAAMFPESTTYTPPTLPAHFPVLLEPVNGAPSEEELLKVQDAIRLYHHYLNVPTMFDPQVNMELSQHLFDIQMGNEAHPTRPKKLRALLSKYFGCAGSINNAGTGAWVPELVQPAGDAIVSEAIGRSNLLAEQANKLSERTNLLIERSNQIAERSNQLVERSSQPIEQPTNLTERFNQLFERLNEHLEQSNCITIESTRPVEKLGQVLGNINRVLVRIQHAIVRNRKGNTLAAVDCLTNEKGETPAMSDVTGAWTFCNLSRISKSRLPVLINGVSKDSFIDNDDLAVFLRFYGIGKDLFDEFNLRLRAGYEDVARERLSEYLSSCLG
ncbi:unnamed protein product [Rhizoctonia solani]|nr:unnamed protein product [Rhizoctonia solani]